jgi:HK97 family phage portal protein
VADRGFVQAFQEAFSGALGLKRRGTNRDIPRALTAHQGLVPYAKWDLDKALKDGYEINEWVHACVNARSQHAASVPWRVSAFTDEEAKARFEYEMKSVPGSQRNEFFKHAHRKTISGRWGGEKKAHLLERPNDPLEQLLEDPNPYMTRQEFYERLMQHKLLGGNGIWVKVRGKMFGEPGYKTPLQLWPLYPQAVEVERDGQVPVKYIYAPEGKSARPDIAQEYDPLDIVHFRFPDPRDSVWGVSPLSAAARAVDTDVQLAKWNLNSAQNRAVPDLLLSFEQELDAKNYQEARRRVAEQSGVDNARNPWVMGNAAKIQQLSLTPVEMDFIRSRGLNRQSVCTIFRVFPAVIMVMEGVSLANMEAVLKYHWIQTVIPDMDAIMSVINKYLTPEFSGNRIAWYDTSNVEAMAESMIERGRLGKIYHTMGVPLEVVNDRLDLGMDLEDVILSDQPIFPAGVVTGDQLLAGDNVTGNGNTDTAPEGGDQVDPGDAQDPNEAPPEDVNPDDPGENPDTALAAELELFTNGSADPHKGVKRWATEEVYQWLLEQGIHATTIKSDDHWEIFPTGVLSQDAINYFKAEAKDQSGIEFSQSTETGLVSLRFYHGEGVQYGRDTLLHKLARFS